MAWAGFKGGADGLGECLRLLLVMGLLITLGFGFFDYFIAPDVPGPVQIMYCLFMLSGVTLFGSQLRERISSLKKGESDK